VQGAIGVAPLGGDDVVDAVGPEVVIAQFRAFKVGRMARRIDHQCTSVRTLLKQPCQGVQAAEVILILADGAFVMADGQHAVAAVRPNHKHAARFGTQHVRNV
jgi:hypothetical protein